MALTAQERERVRYHLGYLNVQLAASISFGIPRPIQTVFLIETAMSNVIAEGEDRVRRMLGVLDRIECLLIDAQERLAAMRLGDLELRENETDKLEREYYRWGGRLADQLGVPFYAYSNRYKNQSGAGNVPVSG
jgi:hypothetical protein